MAYYILMSGEIIELSRLSKSDLEEICGVSLELLSQEPKKYQRELPSGVCIMSREDIAIALKRRTKIRLGIESYFKKEPVEELKKLPKYKILYDLFERYSGE